MTYEEYVLCGMICCTGSQCAGGVCPYFDRDPDCFARVRQDACELLLKRLEPVKRERVTLGTNDWQFVCGSCGAVVGDLDKYCHECGREILK